MKTSELNGKQLNLLVAQLEDFDNGDWLPDYATDWAAGGPIIEREMITVGPAKHDGYMAWAWPKADGYWGDTPLIAAMRCYVASKLGDDADIPEELK